MATNPWDADPIVAPAPGFTGVIPGVGKTPSVPTGYEADPARPGALRPIAGGPEDPATNDTLDDKTTTFYAQQILAGAPMPTMGMGKVAAQNRQKVMAKVAEIAGAQGLTGTDLAKQIAHYQSGKKQLGTLETQLGTTRQNEATATLNGQQFLDRSAELPGQTEFPALNAITQFFQKNLPVPGHDTKVAMDAAYNTFVNEYAKVVNGSPSGAGVLSDNARREAMSVLTGNYSMSQKKAVFDQMKVDMENRMNAMKGGINQGYDALVKQPGYDVPDDTSHLPVAPQKQQDHILIPGVAPPGAEDGAGGGGGSSGPSDPKLQTTNDTLRQMFHSGATTDQIVAYGRAHGVDPNPDEINTARAKGMDVQFVQPDTPEQQKVKKRIAEEDKLGLADSPVETLLKQDATLSLSDEAAGIGNAAANIITSPFTGKFDPVGSYKLGRDVERQRISDAQDTLGYGAAPIEFVGGMASGSPTNALAAVTDVRQLIKMGAKSGAYGGALAGFGSGQGAGPSTSGAVVGGIGGAAVGALAPYAASKLAARGLPKGMAPDVANAAQAEGVDLLRPMVDPASRGNFGALESAPGSQNVIRAGIDKTKSQIEGRVADLGQGGTALNEGAAGEKLQLSGNRYIQRSRGIADRLYRAAENAGGTNRLVPQKAIDQADQEIAALKANPSTNSGEINFLQGIRDDLAAPGGKTVAEIRNIREGLRGAIGNSNLTMSGAEARANSILGAAADDISQAAPQAGRLYKRADAFYRERQTVVDDIKRSILGQKNNPLDPQTAFKNINTLSAKGGNLRRLSAVVSYLDPVERQDVAATVAATLGRKGGQDAPFSTDTFLTQTDKMSPGALRTIFGPDGAQSISNLRLLSQKLKEGVGDINRSKTANSMIRQMATKFVASLTGLGGMAGLAEGGMAGGGTGALTGLAVGAAVKGAQTARNVLSARAMVNPRVSQWLAQAADVSTPSQAQQAVKGLSLVISREPALAHELTPIRDFLDQRVTQLLAAQPNQQEGGQQAPRPLASPPANGFGNRPDGTPKGTGYLGVLKRPDGNVSTELSIGVPINGKEMDIPTLVPGLTKEEVNWLLTTPEDQIAKKLPESIRRKAVAHAEQRLAAGQSPFAN
jgi:hypothetical protein